MQDSIVEDQGDTSVTLVPLRIGMRFRPARIDAVEVARFAEANCVKVALSDDSGFTFDSLEDAIPTVRQKARLGHDILIRTDGREARSLDAFLSEPGGGGEEDRFLSILQSLVPGHPVPDAPTP